MYNVVSCALVVQAEEAAQKEARRLAEEEELREHRRNLQFKVHILSTMLFAAQKLCSTKSIVLLPCASTCGFHLSKLISYITCVALVLPCLFMMMAGGCDTASCTQLSVCAALQARPLPTYGAPFLPSLSGSKLTEAKSPAFCTRSRDR